MIVTPDASVLLRWVLPGDDEQDTGAALAPRDEAVAGTLEPVVSQLWMYEVGNTLVRRFPENADELLASLADFGLTEAKLDAGWRARAASLSVKYGVAFPGGAGGEGAHRVAERLASEGSEVVEGEVAGGLGLTRAGELYGALDGGRVEAELLRAAAAPSPGGGRESTTARRGSGGW
ncbi:MAG: type II toxin-antitoxin system VapC family toxin [Gammaproteobacteria bacterium]|nr:type II toxin-antitoxin system VapC family toxin [Gammaproteobacteria bacterium]MDE0247125.1 type II toxin-antitoxin system VapC family toxin [Gammaproteobacteria bacterium]